MLIRYYLQPTVRLILQSNLADYPILANSEHSQQYTLTLTHNDGTVSTQHVTPKLATTDVMTLYKATLKGLGITRLPLSVVEKELTDGSLVGSLTTVAFS